MGMVLKYVMSGLDTLRVTVDTVMGCWQGRRRHAGGEGFGRGTHETHLADFKGAFENAEGNAQTKMESSLWLMAHGATQKQLVNNFPVNTGTKGLGR